MCVPAVVRMLFVVLVAVGSAQVALAQEAVNYASVSGRVTDPQGAVVPGAQVVARQTETNQTREVVTDDEGRFRLPALRLGPYEITVHLDGFADARSSLALTVGSAFELPVSLAVGNLDTAVTVTGGSDRSRSCTQPDRWNGLADGGAELAPQRTQLPGPGAPRAGRVADQRREHPALCRDVRRTGPGHFDRQPAQFFEQLHRRWAVRERRRRWLERHSVWCRRRGSVSGRDLGRSGGAGASPRRLYQRRHQEWNERRARRSVWLLAR